LTASREIAESSELGVLREHVLKVALLPITTILVFVAATIVLRTLIVDHAYEFLDPRIRLQRKAS
jgi:ABC-type dipeptide/oligopeptide/nickel transport system permease component